MWYLARRDHIDSLLGIDLEDILFVEKWGGVDSFEKVVVAFLFPTKLKPEQLKLLQYSVGKCQIVLK